MLVYSLLGRDDSWAAVGPVIDGKVASYYRDSFFFLSIMNAFSFKVLGPCE